MPPDRLFIDTNVLLAATVPARRGHEIAAALLVEGPRRGVSLVSSGQVLREYMAVATRPLAANGLALSSGQAADNADQLASRLELLDEDRTVAATLRRLVREARQGAAPKFSGSERSFPVRPHPEAVRSDTGNAGGKPQTSRQGGDDRVQGRQVHDASIVATMLAHGLRALVTDDAGDFARFADRITVHTLLGWTWP